VAPLQTQFRITFRKGITMNNMNFFGWIRDGVRQSVLLGVSDAIEQLGSPAATEELHPSVAGFLHVDRNDGASVSGGQRLTAAPGNSSSSGTSGPKNRKRLGRSLKDIGQEAPN
jgi:hypothetical protein